MARAEIALVTPVAPGDSGFGLRMRAGMLRSALEQLGDVRVTVVPVYGPHWVDDGDTVLDLDPAADANADFVARLGSARWRERAAALHPRPAWCRAATMAATEALAEVVAGASLVVVHRLYLVPFLDLVIDGPDRPALLLDVDDVESRRADAEDADGFDRLERHYLPRFDLVLACSQPDADDLAVRGAGDVAVVPNAVELHTVTSHEPARWDIAFVGNLSYGPNIDAATWLVREVMPLLPGVSTVLVGRDPAPAVQALAQPGRVEVTGTVDGVVPYYAASRVAVVPLHVGGGTSIKLIEALAAGRPVVTTSVGARGIDVRADEHVLVADDPAAFASSCRRLLDDADLAGRLAAAGHALVAHRYARPVITAALARLLTPFVEGARRVP